MPPSKREPYADKAVSDKFGESGDLATVARYFEITEAEVTAAIFRHILNSIPRKPPAPARALRLVPKREAA